MLGNMKNLNTTKLVCIGLGHVGSSVLAYAMESGLFADIAAIDVNDKVAHGEALDHDQSTGVPGVDHIHVHAGTYADCADADLIIVSAGASMQPDPDNPGSAPDRAELAVSSGHVIRNVMEGITAHTSEAVILFITNPLDAMVTLAHREFDYPRELLFGTGTMLDSARLRWAVGRELGIDPKSVTGYMMGEHGMTAFPVLSKLNVQGLDWEELEELHHGSLPGREELKETVVGAAYDVFNAKGWTDAGVARSAVAIARSIMMDEKAVHPVCSMLEGEYGIDDVALSMPSVVGRGGVEKRLTPKLDEWETQKLVESADYIRATFERAQG